MKKPRQLHQRGFDSQQSKQISGLPYQQPPEQAA
jgi:hypothetical protein